MLQNEEDEKQTIKKLPLLPNIQRYFKNNSYEVPIFRQKSQKNKTPKKHKLNRQKSVPGIFYDVADIKQNLNFHKTRGFIIKQQIQLKKVQKSRPKIFIVQLKEQESVKKMQQNKKFRIKQIVKNKSSLVKFATQFNQGHQLFQRKWKYCQTLSHQIRKVFQKDQE